MIQQGRPKKVEFTVAQTFASFVFLAGLVLMGAVVLREVIASHQASVEDNRILLSIAAALIVLSSIVLLSKVEKTEFTSVTWRQAAVKSPERSAALPDLLGRDHDGVAPFVGPRNVLDRLSHLLPDGLGDQSLSALVLALLDASFETAPSATIEIGFPT